MSAIVLHGITKRFGATKALDGVDATFRAGAIHALCGQNGSGKSTLVKLLAGVHRQDGGTLAMWGQEPKHMWRPADYGIAVIHQNLALAGEMTVIENFGVTDRYGASGRRPIVSWSEQRRMLDKYSRRFGLDVRPTAPLSSLRPADRALLAIMRAMRDLDQLHDQGGHRLLILDEPTTYLPLDEKHSLGQIVRSLADGGAGVLLVSHELDYVLGLADDLTVLRDGAVAASRQLDGVTKEEVVRLMIGRSLTRFYPERTKHEKGETVLRVEDLSGSRIKSFTTSLRAGEILGVTRLTGGGQEELPYLLKAALERRSRAVHISKDAVASASQTTSPLAIVPAHRETDGVWLEGTAAENLTIASLRTHSNSVLLSRKSEQRRARAVIEDFGVRPARPDAQMSEFSGGNQQKVVLARWLSTDVKVFVLHEPVQGIDVAANAAIFELIVKAAATGAGIVICSNEWDQLVHLCDRVIALHEGAMAQELGGSELTEENLAIACQGGIDRFDGKKKERAS